MVADCVFQTAATVMIWFQTAKRLVISVRHWGALADDDGDEGAVGCCRTQTGTVGPAQAHVLSAVL